MTALRAEGCGIALRAMSFICRSAASVTGFTFVSLLLHDEVQEPPSPGRGWHHQALEDRGVNSLLSSSDLSSALSGSSIPVGQTKGRPFYGQAKSQLCPTWQSYAGLPPEEGAYVTCFSSDPLVILSRRRRISVPADIDSY